MAELPEGWIAHDGGPCPVDGERLITVWLRDYTEPNMHNNGRAREYDWGHYSDDAGQDIIAYKPEGQHHGD